MYLFCEEKDCKEKAAVIADRLNIELRDRGDDDIHLSYNEKGLSLKGGSLTFRGDFSAMSARLRQSNLEHEMLVKAARLKDHKDAPRLLDATAGMGEDSLILAASGFLVDMYEQNEIIAELLRDAMDRALTDSMLKDIVSRMTLHVGDSIKAMEEGATADVILLDPMFPERSKSGLIKKKFQLLQKLESPCNNGDELLDAAIKACPKKIVIKRPAKGEKLGNINVDYSYPGKAIRYDCIVNSINRI